MTKITRPQRLSLVDFKKIYHRWGLSGMITPFAMLAAKGLKLLPGLENEVE
ncbi:MAG: hypothetical protein WC001_01230 [Desulfurivibrionaceae bacterium]